MPTTNYATVNGVILGESGPNGVVVYDADPLGSVTMTSDENSNVLNEYRYKPFGAQLSKSGTAPDPKFLWVGSQGYRQTGRVHSDAYVQARHFGRLEGRWTSVDRLWPREPRYIYVNGRAVLRTDRTGLFGECIVGEAQTLTSSFASSDGNSYFRTACRNCNPNWCHCDGFADYKIEFNATVTLQCSTDEALAQCLLLYKDMDPLGSCVLTGQAGEIVYWNKGSSCPQGENCTGATCKQWLPSQTYVIFTISSNTFTCGVGTCTLVADGAITVSKSAFAHTVGCSLALSYDLSSRMQTALSTLGFSTHTFSPNGNLTQVNEASGVTSMVCDFENRLSVHQSGATVTSYLYYTDNMKALENVSGAHTTLIWDGSDYLGGVS